MKLVCWWLAVAFGISALIGAEVVWFTMLTTEVRWMTLVIGGVAWVAGYLGRYARCCPQVRRRIWYR